MTMRTSLIGTAWAQDTHQEGLDAAAPREEAETHAETGVAHEEPGEHAGAFPPFDPSLFASQILWLAISFGVFYLLMSRVIVPRIGGILETRSDRISQDLDEAQRLKEESDAAYAAYEHELAQARERAHAIGQDAREKAKAEADAKREAVETELAEKLAGAEGQITEIKKRALSEVDDIARSTAAAIVSRLLGRAASATDIARAVKAADRSTDDA